MNITVDLSPAIHQKAGLGRYARTLSEHLVTQDTNNQFTAFAYGKFSLKSLPPKLAALPRANIPLDARPWRMGVWAANGLDIGMDAFFPRMDIFHATEHLLPRFKKAKTVFTLHDLIFQFFPNYHLPLNRWFLTNVMPKFLFNADAIIAVSECTKRDALNFYSLSEDKITVVYEGVNPSLRPEPDPERIARARERYARSQPFLLFVSTIEPRKNIGAVVDALKILRERGRQYRLLVAGRKGWLYKATFDHVRNSGMADFVDFLDFVPDEDLAVLFTACDAFVFPSLYEGFGLSPLEAMACGAPVVASNTSSLPEILGEAALLVNPQEVGDIANAVDRIVTDRNLRAELSGKGIAQAAKYSWDRAARETLRVYERVTNKDH